LPVRAEERQNLLIAELDHPVQNVLATVAVVLEDGIVTISDKGPGQGSVISPLLVLRGSSFVTRRGTSHGKF